MTDLTTEKETTREIVARMIDGEAFGAHALSYKPGPGDFTSNWENRRNRAYRSADEVIAFLSGRLLPTDKTGA